MNTDFSRMVAHHLTTDQAKEQRRDIRKTVGAVLCGLCLAILVIAAKESYGAEKPVLVAAYGPLTVYLYDKPCTHEVVLAMLEKRVHSSYKAGEAMHARMGHRQLCYLSHPAYPKIFLIDELGEQANLPKEDFAPQSDLKGRKGEVSI